MIARSEPGRAVVAGSSRPARVEGGLHKILAGSVCAFLVLGVAAPAAGHHVGAYVPKDNAVTTNFKQVKFSVQAKKFDVALRLFETGALRTEMRAHASTLPAGLEEGTRAALKASDGPEVSPETRELRYVQDLVTQGRRQGYLTYAELSEALPDVLTTEQLDEVMAVFGEAEIAVVDAANRVQLPNTLATCNGRNDGFTSP